MWLPAIRAAEAKVPVQLNGELVPLHTAPVARPPSTLKLSVPMGTVDPEKLTRAVRSTAAVPEISETGVTVTTDVGRDETVKVEVPLVAL